MLIIIIVGVQLKVTDSIKCMKHKKETRRGSMIFYLKKKNELKGE